MPSLDLDTNNARFQIRGYKPGLLQVNDKTYEHSIIISNNELIDPWEPQSVQTLTPASFTSIIALKPDIVLIGTGETQVFLSAELFGELINLGIGVEVMSTASACRTYNVLTAEDRRVAAALIIR